MTLTYLLIIHLGIMVFLQVKLVFDYYDNHHYNKIFIVYVMLYVMLIAWEFVVLWALVDYIKWRKEIIE